MNGFIVEYEVICHSMTNGLVWAAENHCNFRFSHVWDTVYFGGGECVLNCSCLQNNIELNIVYCIKNVSFDHWEKMVELQ